MDLDRLNQQIRFIIEADKLKSVLRQNYLPEQDRHENTAEHCWHLALMAFLLVEYADSEINIGHVIEILLIHDLVEIYAGDTYCYDEDETQDQEEREAQAAEKLFGLLPLDQSARLHELRNEFEEGRSPESKFAASLDRLMPLLLNYYSQGRSWKEHSITADQVLTRNRLICEGSDQLWSFAQSIIEDSITKGYLAAESDPNR
ncbi:MAG: phosphohydrolase [Anaerolineae bacterium SM23_ 63]|nr:MAG: phosphohydrolase [Anaerolineae bacterium SM23_ 63]HEY46223.1 HD domain-containing protein [Anaerolineae bacterium]